MEIPISRVISDSEKGVFRYLKGFPLDKAIQGVFAFSFYFRGEAKDLPANLYLQGLSLYEKIIQQSESVFEHWRIVVYMDKATYELLKVGLFLVDNPLVECVIVDWPYYETTPGMVNGDVLRCMRLRAFFDFNTIPVFVRDADTLFVVNLYNPKGELTGERKLYDEPEIVYKWEKAYYEGAQKHPNTLIFGTSLGYHRFWHEKAPLGAFAGLQSAMPTIPCFTKESLWDRAIDYILKRSVRSEEIANTNSEGWMITGNGVAVKRNVKKGERVISFSNEQAITRHGKDEQILLFVFLPECFETTFFFELDMNGVRLPYYSFKNTVYPTKIFRKGSNVNIGAVFKKAFEKETKESNIEKMKYAIQTKNKALETQRIKEFERYIETTESRNLDIQTKPPAKVKTSGEVTYGKLTFNFGPPSLRPPPKVDPILPKVLTYINKALDDPSIEAIFTDLKKKEVEKTRSKHQLRKLFVQNESESEKQILLQSYEEAVKSYNEAVYSFLSKVQQIDEYEKKILEKTSVSEHPDIKSVLEWIRKQKKGGGRSRNRTRRCKKTNRPTRRRV